MKKSLLAIIALAALCAPAYAAGPMGVIKGPGGSTYLYGEAGPVCMNGAFKAEYVPLRGKPIGACWKAVQGGVSIAFFDGDSGEVSSESITKPETL